MRITKSAVIVILAVTLLSCDIFLVSKEGRWNPLDPNNELVEVNGRALSAITDGFVSDTDDRYFNEPFLVTDWNCCPYMDILIRFDTRDLPEFVEHAQIEIFVESVAVSEIMDVYLIAQPWNKDDISWFEVDSPGFVVTSIPMVPSFDIATPGIYETCDVTEYIQFMQKKNIDFGFRLTSILQHMEFSSSRGANPPVLRVWGLEIPE